MMEPCVAPVPRRGLTRHFLRRVDGGGLYWAGHAIPGIVFHLLTTDTTG